MKNSIQYSKNFINNLLKVCLDNDEYNQAIDFLTSDMHRHDFKLNGENKICFYHDFYLLISIDTLDNYSIVINTNIIQSRTFELTTGQKFTGNNLMFKTIPFQRDIKIAIKYLRKEKLEKLNREKTI